MKYKCFDIFAIRSPILPKSYFNRLTSKGTECIFDIYKLSEHKDIIDEAIRVSSKSLFEGLHGNITDEKKKKNIKHSLIKYLTRMSTRPTPYGLFAGVGLGRFEKTTNILQTDDYIKSVEVDHYWIKHIIHQLEKDDQLLLQLRVKWNEICYESGSRIINPYFSNHGDLSDEKDNTEEINVRNTIVLKIIRNNTKKFVFTKNIVAILAEAYPEVEIQRIISIIAELVENEILLTELRLPAYCEDRLKYVINKLSNANYDGLLFKQLVDINNLILQYRNVPLGKGVLLLGRLYDAMGAIFKTSNYIEVNLGKKYLSNTLSNKIQKQLEIFVDELSYLTVSAEDLSELNDFKHAFAEEYGKNIEVPLAKVIDVNGFNGFRFLRQTSQHNISPREHKIKDIVDQKILRAIYEHKDEINLHKEDFQEIQNDSLKYEYPKTLDMNFFIHFKDIEKDLYYIEVAPIGGAPKAGMTIQRFNNVLDSQYLRKYSEIYNYEKRLTDNLYINVEQRECISRGRGENVINNTCNYEYCLCVACSTNYAQEVLLSDLYIGLASNNKLYIKSKSMNEIVKIVSDNMLNPKLNSKLLYLLKKISYEYEDSIISRLFSLYENKYNYIPRIIMSGIVLQPKTWIFDETILPTGSLNEFKEKLLSIRKVYNIENNVYLSEADNRLLIDLDDDNYIQIIYNTFKRKKKIIFHEIGNEGVSTIEIGRDIIGNEYIVELSSSFYLVSPSIELFNAHYVNRNKALIENNREYSLGNEGWIYFKLYGDNSRRKEIITQYIDLLNRKINPEKFFFIRYADPDEHLRIRLKFENKSIAIQQIRYIMEWFTEIKEIGLAKNIVFDTYYRESNRYGGDRLIDDIEDFFYSDSMFVISLLNQFNLDSSDNLEKCYLVGMISVLAELTDGIEEMLKVMDNNSDNPVIRKEYKKARNEYKNLFDSIYNGEIISKDMSDKVQAAYFQRSVTLKKVKTAMLEEARTDRLTNSKDSIILSMIHMFCNRLYGYNPLEEKYSIILRNILYDKNSKIQNYKEQYAGK